MTAEQIQQLARQLGQSIADVYASEAPFPGERAQLPALSAKGLGPDRVSELWDLLVAQSAHLASPWMSGHMDTAPHPIAALTQGLVASLNNNLLFRELSPMASDAEQALISMFIEKLALGEDWSGVFTSGGSIANLTALFAAVGGYEGGIDRREFYLFAPASGHASLSKSAAILGLPKANLAKIACDEGGRMIPSSLASAMDAAPAGARKIVVCVVGTTIHGSVDDVSAIAEIARRHYAWLHVDLIYATALAFSARHSHWLNGLADADSIALGPQKWMYVPRVSALTLVRGSERFEKALAVALPYSLGELEHRGKWGLQGSRPADAAVLWVLLAVMGTEFFGRNADASIAHCRVFHEMLAAHPLAQPSHSCDLNLQTFRLGEPDGDGSRLLRAQRILVDRGRTWFSLARWQDEVLFRSVFLSPQLTEDHLAAMLADTVSAFEKAE